jgi:DNA-binding response OmpR family regulator
MFPKPFDLRELLARVRAVLRRAERSEEAPATMGTEVRVGRNTYNVETGGSTRRMAPTCR